MKITHKLYRYIKIHTQKSENITNFSDHCIGYVPHVLAFLFRVLFPLFIYKFFRSCSLASNCHFSVFRTLKQHIDRKEKKSERATVNTYELK